MKKRVFGVKLSRGKGARMALRRSLVRSLVLNGRIITTKAKAKFVRRDIERLVKDAIDGSLAKKRKIYSFLANDREISSKIFELAKSFGSLSSGFTRIIPLGRRRGDNAETVRLEWSQKPDIVGEKKKDKKQKEKTVAQKEKKDLLGKTKAKKSLPKK